METEVKINLAKRDDKGRRISVYNSWVAMRQRCNNPNNPKYSRYGGRGITVCKEWYDIKVFYNWAIQNGWKEGLTIDRINPDGNYEPENCRWLTVSENSRYKSTTKITDEQAEEIRRRKGEKLSVLAKEYGCCSGTIWWIVNGRTHVAEGECARLIKERRALKNFA